MATHTDHIPAGDDADDRIAKIRAIVPADAAGQEALPRLEELVQSMARDGVRRDDPMREVFARMGDKWSMLLLHLLHTGSYRHAMLRRLVSVIGHDGRISQRMLTLRLRALERDGFIARDVVSTHPPRVTYALTDLGRGLVTQLVAHMRWIRAHQRAIHEARERFSVREAVADEADE